MFCRNCGKEIDEKAVVCPNCGVQVQPLSQQTSSTNHPVDSDSIGWGFLGFFFPVSGLVLYLCWKSEKPKASKVVGIGSLIGVIVYFIFLLLFV